MHRHSGSKSASIPAIREQDRAVIEVIDHGKGIPAEKLAEIQLNGAGVGIRGMRERLRQFSGALTIESSEAGTTVIAAIPVLKEFPARTQDPTQAFESAR
ncbi:MAG TPA: ATP-binding protein [Candidatus Dormibacteraeota bacterium]|nr:ATP-binding protein [Candidatus Dormibacteraeota bacterium]